MDSDLLDLNLTGKKKKKKKPTSDYAEISQSNSQKIDENLIDEFNLQYDVRLVDPEDPESDYKYSYLLARVHKDYNWQNTTCKVSLVAPEIKKEARKSLWVNCKHFSSSISRDPCHVTEFITAELSTTGSFDNYGTFIFKGRYDSQKVQTILRQYIATYVMCDACKSLQTYLERDTASKLLTLVCGNCTSTRTVRKIKFGYIAKI